MGGQSHVDHAWEEYTEQQQADLADVLAFNRELVAAGESGHDLTAVTRHLDPDPARYIWVDEGGGRLPDMIGWGRRLLAEAPPLPGHVRYPTQKLGGQGAATRPTVAAAADGRVLAAWLSWEAGVGEHVIAALFGADGETLAEPRAITEAPSDCFRPTAAFDPAGHPRVFYARATPGVAGRVGVFARSLADGAWGAEERISTTEHPSFNQEVVLHDDGSLECVWQGRVADEFGVYARRWRDGEWEASYRLDGDVPGNVWDPSVTPLPGGRSAYVWSAYEGGAYRLVARYGDADGLGASQQLTTGSDYALHPSLVTAGDGSVWCAFDLLSIQGHGGSGPTALQAADRLHDLPSPGMREAGEFVPPEMIPNADAAVHAVRLTEDGIEEDPIPLGQGVEVNPSGMPAAAPTADGGITVAYRVLRRLPLLHYYWEVAVQQLGPDGPGPVCTLADSDGGNEEPAVATMPEGAAVVCTTDGRKQRALEWTEGFGGQRCAQLAAHVGEIAWHGLHGTGQVALAALPDAATPRRGTPQPAVHGSEREEARAWVGGRRSRYETEVDGRRLTLCWGDLHRHSLISRCTAADDPALDDFYRFAWDVFDYDFWAVTDHAENSTAHQWWTLQKVADLFHLPDRFVPLYGFEWTSELGHQNVIYGDVERGAPIFSATDEQTDRPDKLWAAMRQYPDYPAITIPHHPGASMVPYDWGYGDPEFLRLAEVFQSCRGNYEDDGCFRQYADGTLTGTFTVDGLRRGHRFGLIASSDHGHGASYVGAYADGLTRADVFAALRERRVFAATAPGIVLDVRVDDTFMGGERRQDDPAEVRAHVEGYRELARVDVLRDGELAHAVEPELDLPDGWLAVPLRVEWGRAGKPRDWSGGLRIDGGEVVQTAYVNRELREITRTEMRWEAVTHSFGGGGLYGPTRGGVDLTVVGPPEASVDVDTASGGLSASLDQLRAGTVVASGPRAPEDSVLRLQRGLGGLRSLGTTTHDLTWADPSPPPAWYYVRAVLVDGEMAWSSPIWVDPTQG